MEGLNFAKFKIAFEGFKQEQEQMGISKDNLFITHISNKLNELDKNENFAKIFRLTDKQKDFFIKGKVKVDKNMEIKLPFHTIFLDLSFTNEELAEYGIKTDAEQLVGLIVSKGYVYTSNDNEIVEEQQRDIPEKSVGEALRFSICFIHTDKETRKRAIQFETFFKNVVFTKDDYEDKDVLMTEGYVDTRIHDFWYRFFLNLVRFVNYPEVRLKEHKKSESNIARRIRRGRPVIPDIITVELTGILEKYIDEVYEQPKAKWHYNYSFDVKGHPRHLTSPRYKFPREIWVEPYTKGVGKHVPSVYDIKKEKY